MRGSGQFGVTVTITAAQELPFAQLAVFRAFAAAGQAPKAVTRKLVW